MGLEEPSAAPRAPKVQKEQKKEVKKDVPKRAELGALSFNVRAHTKEQEAPVRPAPGLPPPAAPFQDVSNIQALPSPNKSSSPIRRASPALPDQENPQVARAAGA